MNKTQPQEGSEQITVASRTRSRTSDQNREEQGRGDGKKGRTSKDTRPQRLKYTLKEEDDGDGKHGQFDNPISAELKVDMATFYGTAATGLCVLVVAFQSALQQRTGQYVAIPVITKSVQKAMIRELDDLSLPSSPGYSPLYSSKLG